MKKFDISNIIVYKIQDVYSYTLPARTEGESIISHNTLLFRRSGCSEYEVEGKKYILDAENMLFLPEGTEYSMFVREAGECTIIEFDTTDEPSAEVCEFFTESDKDIVSTVKSLLHYWKLKGPSYHSKCLSELYSLLTALSTVQSFTYSLASKYRMIHKSVKYIETNYRKPDLYTGTLAEMSGMGETYYRSIFLSVFSIAPARYIQNYRIEKAKELLVNSSGAVEEIATAVGFANASYFCRVFKQTTGLTPTEFAAKSKKLG